MNTARFILCIVGFLGFALTFFNGVLAGSDLIIVLRDAAIACVVAGLIAQAFLHIILTAVASPEPQPAGYQNHQESSSDSAQAEHPNKPTAAPAAQPSTKAAEVTKPEASTTPPRRPERPSSIIT